MSKFSEAMATNPSRLVVLFRHDECGQEQFTWGIVGTLPTITLIGYLTRVQAGLAHRWAEPRQDCDQSALVVAWTDGKFSWFVHPDIPVDSLVGMLDLIKAYLVDSKLAEQASAAQTGLVDKNGKPILRNVYRPCPGGGV